MENEGIDKVPVDSISTINKGPKGEIKGEEEKV